MLDPKQKLSLGVHTFFAIAPFIAGTASAFLLWSFLFKNWWFALAAILVVEIPALSGLLMHLFNIQSPLARLRHVVAVVSSVPLGWELWQLLQHNGWFLAGVLVVVLIVVLATLNIACVREIERIIFSMPQSVEARVAAQDATTRQQLELLQAQAASAMMMAQAYQQAIQQLAQAPAQLALPAPQVAQVQAEVDIDQDGDNTGGTGVATGREIVYNGVTYPSIAAAARAFGITRQAMQQRLLKEVSA